MEELDSLIFHIHAFKMSCRMCIRYFCAPTLAAITRYIYRFIVKMKINQGCRRRLEIMRNIGIIKWYLVYTRDLCEKNRKRIQKF